MTMPMPKLQPLLNDEPGLFENILPQAKPEAQYASVKANPKIQAAPVPKPIQRSVPSKTVAKVELDVAPTRKIEKSATAYRTISEVAEELNVPQHVLRFWETKFTQLRPLKRGGGRRYYRAEDVTLIRQIHSLLYAQGYTIKGAQKVLKDKVMHPPEEPAEDIVARDVAILSPEQVRATLVDMLAELKALRALV